jgi:CBS domain-containing protein
MSQTIATVITGRQLYTIASAASAREAAKYLEGKEVGAVAVVDDGNLKGILSERDLVQRIIAAGADPSRVTVGEIMTANPITMQSSQTLSDALDEFRTRKFRHLPVMSGDTLVGMLSVRDLYAAIQSELEDDLHEREALIFGLPQL